MPNRLGVWFGGLARRLYDALPLSMSFKLRCKDFLFRRFALVFRRTRAYRDWRAYGREDDSFRLVIEYCVVVPGQGLFLQGWLADPARRLKRLYALDRESGDLIGIDHDRLIRMPRGDVVRTVEAEAGLVVRGWPGFLIFAPFSQDNAGFRGERVGILALDALGRLRELQETRSECDGSLDGIKRILNGFPSGHPRRFEILGGHLDPVIRYLSGLRQRPALQRQALRYGASPERPQVSIIVPLYGRYDFMQYQLALFANDPEIQASELLYVVDDPRIFEPVSARSAYWHDLFRVPFTVLYSGHNLGYAGANNFAAADARGDHLLLLNSDVMPKYPGWLGRMLAAYQTLDAPGALTPKLLYEDGTLQHAGMEFRADPQCPGIWWNYHRHKGLPEIAAFAGDALPCPAVTGACLLLERRLFEEVGGLDERFLLGDFEDSDLCLKLLRRGRRNYCLLSVELFHLERQSQSLVSREDWKENMTLYNAWQQSSRWADLLGKLAS